MQLQTLLKVSLSSFTGRGCSARARPTVSPLSRARDLDRSVSQSRDRRGIHCRGRNVEEGRSGDAEKSRLDREREEGSLPMRRGAHCSRYNNEMRFVLPRIPRFFPSTSFFSFDVSIILSITKFRSFSQQRKNTRWFLYRCSSIAIRNYSPPDYRLPNLVYGQNNRTPRSIFSSSNSYFRLQRILRVRIDIWLDDDVFKLSFSELEGLKDREQQRQLESASLFL